MLRRVRVKCGDGIAKAEKGVKRGKNGKNTDQKGKTRKMVEPQKKNFRYEWRYYHNSTDNKSKILSVYCKPVFSI